MSTVTEHLRKPFLAILVGIVVAVFLLWWFALMSPQSSKLSSLNSQQLVLRSTVNGLDAKIALLKSEQGRVPAELDALECDQLAVPLAVGEPSIIAALSGVEAQSGATVQSFSIAPPTLMLPGGSASGKKKSASSMVIESSQVQLSVDGSYAQVLSFVKGLYGLQRLFVITAFNLGGSLTPQGTGTYTMSLGAEVFNVAPPSVANAGTSGSSTTGSTTTTTAPPVTTPTTQPGTPPPTCPPPGSAGSTSPSGASKF